MDKILNNIVRNSVWTTVFGILAIILGVFIYKKRLIKQFPAWVTMLLCLVQCFRKGFVAALYGECYKVPSDAYRLVRIITFVGNVTEIVTTLIVLVVLIWGIRCLKTGD